MDRNLWIRIQATGAEQAGAAVRRVGQEMRTLGRDVKVAAQTVRAGSEMAGASIAKTYSAIPGKMRTSAAAIGAVSREIRQTISQTFQSAGLLKTGPAAQTQLGSQLNLLKTQAQVALTAVKQQFAGASTTILGATRQWASDTRIAGGMILQTTQGAIRTGFTSVAASARVMAVATKSAVTSAVASLGPYKDRVEEVARESAVASHSIGIALAAIGGGIVFAFGEAFKTAAKFQEEMQNVAAVIQKSPALIANLSKEVINLSRTLPQSPQKLAEGLYEIAQAGFLGQKAFIVLKAAATAASAGLTDTVTASRGLIAILSAYGYSVNKSAYISDVLFQTVKVGIVTFEELSQQIGDFVGFAAAAGIKIEDLGIAMATMTRAGIPAAEASTSLNRVIQAIVKPSVDMRKEMEKLGLSVADLRNPSIGLIGVIQRLQHATGGNIVTLQKMFREIRAARGAYALMADNGKLLNKVMQQFGTTSQINGQTLKALAQQSKGFNYQWQIMKNQFSALAIQVGSQLLPVMTATVKIIGAVVGWFSKLPGPVKYTVAGLTALVGVAILLSGVMFLLAPRIVAVSDAVTILGIDSAAAATAIKVSLATFGIISAVLIAASVAFSLFSNNQKKSIEINDDFSRSVRKTGVAISDAGKQAIQNDLADKGLVTYMNNLNINSDSAINSIQGVDGAQQDLFKNVAASIQRTAPQVYKFLNTKDWNNLKLGLNGNTKAMSAFNSELKSLQFGVAEAGGGKGGVAIRVTDQQKDSLNELAKVLDYVNVERAKTTKALLAYQQAAGLNAKTTAKVTQETAGLADAQGQLAAQGAQLTDEQKGLNELFKSVVSPADAYTAATDALKPLTTLTGVYSDKLQAEQKQIDAAASTLSRKHNQALTDATNAARDAAKAQSRIAQDQSAQIGAITKRGSGLAAVVRQQGKESTRAAQDAATNVARANSKLRSVTADYKHDAQISITQYLGALGKAASDQKSYYNNVENLTRRHFGDLASSIADGSKESAGLLQLLAAGTNTQLKKVQDYYKHLGPSATQSFQQFITQLQKKAQDFATLNANITKLVTHGRKGLVDLITTSDLNPAQQAQLINEAAGASKKGLDKIQALLADTQDQASESFSVWADSISTVVDGIVQNADKLGKVVTFDELYQKYVKLTGDTKTTKEAFIRDLEGMGGAIKDLPKNVQVIVAANVNGTEKIGQLSSSLDGLKQSLRGVDSEVAKNVLGTLGQDIQTELNGANIQAKTSFKALSISTSIVNIVTSKINSLPKADGGITSYASGAVLPKRAVIEKPQRGLVQWAEPETGGEAFIPLAKGKRARSVTILGTVAETFGYALIPQKMGSGGTIEPRKMAAGGMTYPVEVNAEVRPMAFGGISAGGMGARTIRHLEPAGVARGGDRHESHTYNENITIEKLTPNNYTDFLRQVEREAQFKSMPGNFGGRRMP